eukprot:6182548-Pleurochrysis_carterae.AAC.1
MGRCVWQRRERSSIYQAQRISGSKRKALGTGERKHHGGERASRSARRAYGLCKSCFMLLVCGRRGLCGLRRARPWMSRTKAAAIVAVGVVFHWRHAVRGSDGGEGRSVDSRRLESRGKQRRVLLPTNTPALTLLVDLWKRCQPLGIDARRSLRARGELHVLACLGLCTWRPRAQGGGDSSALRSCLGRRRRASPCPRACARVWVGAFGRVRAC